MARGSLLLTVPMWCTGQYGGDHTGRSRQSLRCRGRCLPASRMSTRFIWPWMWIQMWLFWEGNLSLHQRMLDRYIGLTFNFCARFLLLSIIQVCHFDLQIIDLTAASTLAEINHPKMAYCFCLFKSRCVSITTAHMNVTVLEMWYVIVKMVIVVKLDVIQDMIINSTDHLPVRKWRKVWTLQICWIKRHIFKSI